VQDVSIGRIRAWIDGTLVTDRQNLNTGTVDLSMLQLGADGGGLAVDYYFDDFMSDDAVQIGCDGSTSSPSEPPPPLPPPGDSAPPVRSNSSPSGILLSGKLNNILAKLCNSLF